jgi:hypothetical protein
MKNGILKKHELQTLSPGQKTTSRREQTNRQSPILYSQLGFERWHFKRAGENDKPWVLKRQL